MTIRNLAKIALTLTVVLTFAACSDAPIVKPPALPASPLEFFQANGAPVQVKTIKVGTTPVKATFAGGTALTFAVGAVQDGSGNPYSGDVVLSVREISTKSDMVLSNVLTVSNESPLVSGGMFFLDLKTPAGAALNINPAVGVGAAVPIVDNKPPVPGMDRPMQQFVGSSTTCATTGVTGVPTAGGAPIAAGDSSVNWCPVAGQFGIDNTTLPGSYVFSVFKKDWVNCDFFYNDPRPKTTLRVTFDAINDANTVLFLIPQSVNTVISLYTLDGPNKRKSYDNSLPIGLTAELVALTFNGGKQYLAYKTVTLSANQTENLTFNEATTAQIKAFLTPLN